MEPRSVPRWMRCSATKSRAICAVAMTALERIEDGGLVLAIILRNEPAEPGIHLFTPSDYRSNSRLYAASDRPRDQAARPQSGAPRGAIHPGSAIPAARPAWRRFLQPVAPRYRKPGSFPEFERRGRVLRACGKVERPAASKSVSRRPERLTSDALVLKSWIHRAGLATCAVCSRDRQIARSPGWPTIESGTCRRDQTLLLPPCDAGRPSLIDFGANIRRLRVPDSFSSFRAAKCHSRSRPHATFRSASRAEAGGV